MTELNAHADAFSKLRGREATLCYHSTLTDWGWRCPLSQISTSNCVSSSQCETLSTVKATVAVVLKCSRRQGAIHASVDRTLQRLTGNG